MTDPTRAAELTAAVERLRRLKNYGGDEYPHEVYKMAASWAIIQRKKDEAVLANAYLATVAADEAVEITEDWLRSFMPIDTLGLYYHPELPGYISSSDSGEFWRWMVDGHILCVMNTRGELRRLFIGLDIALTPIGQEEQS